MASNDTAALVVALSAQIDKFEKSMQQAARVADKHVKEIETRFEKMNGVLSGKMQELGNIATGQLGILGQVFRTLGPAGTAAAVGIGGLALGLEAIADRVKNLRELASRTKESAEQARFSTLQFSAFGAILEKHGGDAEAATGALVKLNVAHAQAADGEGELFKTLRQVNPALAEQFADAKSGAAAFEVFNRALKEATTNQRDLLLRQGLGRGGSRIEETLKEITERGGLDAVAQALLKVGRILDPGLIDNLDELAKRSREKSAQIKNNWDSVAVSIDNGRRSFIEWLGVSKEDSERGFISKQARRATEFLLGRPEETIKARIVAPQDVASTEAAVKATSDLNAQIKLLEDGRRRLINEQFDTTDVDQFKRLEKGIDDATASIAKLKEQRDQVNAKPLQLTVSPAAAESMEAQISRLRRIILLQEEAVAKKGTTATGDEKFAIEQNKILLDQLQKVPVLKGEEAAAVERTAKVHLSAADIAQKAHLGVATEEERRLQFERELELLGPRLALNDQQKAEALRIYNKELKDTIEREQVRRSNLPQLTQLGLDAQNLNKQFDTLATSGLKSFEDALADAGTGTKTLSQAFSDMSKSILRDLIKLVVRSSITGPLAKALTGLLGGPTTATPAVSGFAEGGTIPAHGLGIVAEHSPSGPRLIRAGNQPIAVTPNDIAGGGGGLSVLPPVVNVHNYTGEKTNSKVNSDGSVDVFVGMMDNALAEKSLRGQSAFGKMHAAQAGGRSLRGA